MAPILLMLMGMENGISSLILFLENYQNMKKNKKRVIFLGYISGLAFSIWITAVFSFRASPKEKASTLDSMTMAPP